MNTRNVVVMTGLLILLALGGNTYISLHDHAGLTGLVHAESVQRVTTIGERCETTMHESEVLTDGLGAGNPQSKWFAGSYRKCLKSLAKVEKRAHVRYVPRR
jgi:hypothetical protein